MTNTTNPYESHARRWANDERLEKCITTIWGILRTYAEFDLEYELRREKSHFRPMIRVEVDRGNVDRRLANYLMRAFLSNSRVRTEDVSSQTVARVTTYVVKYVNSPLERLAARADPKEIYDWLHQHKEPVRGFPSREQILNMLNVAQFDGED